MARPTDIRLQVDFLSHPKFIKLSRLHGAHGVVSVLLLWCHAGAYKTSGVLTGMDEEEILIVCKQPPEIEIDGKLVPNTFVQELVRPIRLLDQLNDGTFVIHDWEEWQRWVAESKKRSEAGKKGAEVRWGSNDRKKEPLKNSEESDGSMANNGSANGSVNGSANAPSPSPPFHKSPQTPQGAREGVSVEMILELFNSILHELPKAEMGRALKRKILERIKEEGERRAVLWWKELFLRVSRCPDLIGFASSGWKASLAWIVSKPNLARIEAGHYREEEGAKQGGGWSEEEYAQMQAEAQGQ